MPRSLCVIPAEMLGEGPSLRPEALAYSESSRRLTHTCTMHDAIRTPGIHLFGLEQLEVMLGVLEGHCGRRDTKTLPGVT